MKKTLHTAFAATVTASLLFFSSCGAGAGPYLPVFQTLGPNQDPDSGYLAYGVVILGYTEERQAENLLVCEVLAGHPEAQSGGSHGDEILMIWPLREELDEETSRCNELLDAYDVRQGKNLLAALRRGTARGPILVAASQPVTPRLLRNCAEDPSRHDVLVLDLSSRSGSDVRFGAEKWAERLTVGPRHWNGRGWVLDQIQIEMRATVTWLGDLFSFASG